MGKGSSYILFILRALIGAWSGGGRNYLFQSSLMSDDTESVRFLDLSRLVCAGGWDVYDGGVSA